MAIVYLGLGSNLQAERYIPLGVQALAEHYPTIVCSTVYASKAIGLKGNDFYNLVVKISTQQSLNELYLALKQLEQAHGRGLSESGTNSHTLDIDVLLYDDVITQQPCILPRPDIYQYAFVLRPLSELAPDLVHPRCHTKIKQLWKDFDQATQTLKPVTIHLF